MEWRIVIHQFFWTCCSFALFFFFTKFFILERLFEISKRRFGKEQELQKKANVLIEKAAKIFEEANGILEVEIPEKKKAFVERSIKTLCLKQDELFFQELEILKKEYIEEEKLLMKEEKSLLEESHKQIEGSVKLFLDKVI